MIPCRNATRAELKEVLEWAANEGWNPGLDDAAPFFAADPQGFFVAVDSDDAPVAAISVVNHGDGFAFLGLYIVRQAYRGRGIGLALWRHAMTHAGDRIVGLDGVEDQQQNYIASGFRHAGGTTRFSGRIAGRVDPDVRAVPPDRIPALIAMEADASGVLKPAYLRAWFTDTAHRKTIVMTSATGIDGFCTVRNCREGAKIGPLVARSTDVADRLIRHAATLCAGTLTLDVPDTAVSLAALCTRHGLTPGFKTARMYLGRFAAPHHYHFAVTSLELG